MHHTLNAFATYAHQDWGAISRALKPGYQTAKVEDAEERLLEFQEGWAQKYPAIVRLWLNNWTEFVPFSQFDRDIRLVYTTNAIESVNARIRKAVKARSRFLNEQAMLKCVYLAVMALDPTGNDRAR